MGKTHKHTNMHDGATLHANCLNSFLKQLWDKHTWSGKIHQGLKHLYFHMQVEKCAHKYKYNEQTTHTNQIPRILFFSSTHTKPQTHTLTHNPLSALCKLPPGGALVCNVAAVDWVCLKCSVMRELVNSRWKGSISLCAAVCLTCQWGDNFIHITCRHIKQMPSSVSELQVHTRSV